MHDLEKKKEQRKKTQNKHSVHHS